MKGRRHAAVAVFVALSLLATAGPASAADRLDRFRALAATRVGAAHLGGDADDPTERAMLTLVDEEIVESLSSGGVFASQAFLEERLQGFAEAWGGVAFRLSRAGALLVLAMQFSDVPAAGSVRVYGRRGDHAGLVAALERQARPSVHPLPAAPRGGTQFVVAWEGPPSGRGSRSLRLDLVRQRGDAVDVVWTTPEAGGPPLMAREHRVRGGEITIRYELHYAGWTPGCDRQAEEEDVYRLVPGGAFARVGRRQVNAWHVALHEAAGRVFAALASGDARALAAVVPDAALRRRLPHSLVADAACDAAEGADPVTASVAAAGERGPWTLTFRRAAGRWRLTAASAVLE